MFYYDHVAAGGIVRKVPDELVMYRYVPGSFSFSVPRLTLLHIRVAHFERMILERRPDEWTTFGIWGAGRDGKQFLKALKPAYAQRVAAFYDIDPKKIERKAHFDEGTRRHIPIRHWTAATAPFVVCVALDRTDGALEANLASLGLTEGRHYFHVI